MKKPVSDIPVPPSLLTSTRLLALMGGVAMVTTRELEFLFTAVFLGLFVLGLVIGRFRRLSRLIGVVEPFMAAFVFFVGLADFFFLSNSFLLSAAHFLLTLQGLRLLALRTPRENMGSILLSTLMMLSASTLAVDYTYFVILVVFLPTILWTLILHNAVLESGSQVLIPLWSIRTGTLMSFSVAVLCCVVTFVLFPRINFRQWRGEFLKPVHKTGFTNQVDLNQSGRIAEDDSIVMRVEISPEERSLWTGYLRGATLETFDGQSWTSSLGNGKRIFNQGLQGIHVPPKWIARGERLKQKIYLESMESPVLFAAPRPFVIKIDRPFIFLGEDGSFRRAFGDGWRCQYEVESRVIKPYEKDSLRSLARRQRDQFVGEEEAAFQTLSVPVTDIARETRRIVSGYKTPREAAERISQFLSNEYAYSLDFRGGTGKDPLRSFLFERKSGHCEYFASAMCVMLRTLDIPSRLVTGFYSHEWNERGHYVIVRMRHAHSWVEAFIEPYGWVEFDPSPLQWEAPRSFSPWMKRITDFTDSLNLAWNRYILSYDIIKQVEMVRAVYFRSRRISRKVDSWLGGFQGRFRWNFWKKEKHSSDPVAPSASLPQGGAAPLILIGGIFFLTGFFWLLLKREKLSPVWFYASLLRFLQKKGNPKSDSQTLREYVLSLEKTLNGFSPDVWYLVDMYHRLRFYPHALPTSQENKRIKAAVKRLK